MKQAWFGAISIAVPALLAAQTGRAPPAARRQTEILGSELIAPRAQKIAELSAELGALHFVIR